MKEINLFEINNNNSYALTKNLHIGNIQYASVPLKTNNKKQKLILPQINYLQAPRPSEPYTKKRMLLANNDSGSPQKNINSIKKASSEKKMIFGSAFADKKLSQLNRKIINFNKHQSKQPTKSPVSVKKNQRQINSPSVLSAKKMSKPVLHNASQYNQQYNQNLLSPVHTKDTSNKKLGKVAILKQRAQAPIKDRILNERQQKPMKLAVSRPKMIKHHSSGQDAHLYMNLGSQGGSGRLNMSKVQQQKTRLQQKIELINNQLQRQHKQLVTKPSDKFYLSDKKSDKKNGVMNSNNNKNRDMWQVCDRNSKQLKLEYYENNINMWQQQTEKNMCNYVQFRGMLIDLGINKQHEAFKIHYTE